MTSLVTKFWFSQVQWYSNSYGKTKGLYRNKYRLKDGRALCHTLTNQVQLPGFLKAWTLLHEKSAFKNYHLMETFLFQYKQLIFLYPSSVFNHPKHN